MRFFCQEVMRSHLVVSLGEGDAVGKTQRRLAQFFEKEHPVPSVLSVAGPRESKAGEIQKRARQFVEEVCCRGWSAEVECAARPPPPVRI